MEEINFGPLKKKAKAKGWTVNDLALIAAYRMMEDWCEIRKIPFKALDMGSSMDHRQFADKVILENFSIPRVVKLFPEKISDDEKLITAIKKKYHDIAASHYHYFVSFIIRALSRIPYSFIEKGMRRKFLKEKLPIPSITVANLGDIGKKEKLQHFGPARVTFFYPGGRGLFLPGYALTVFSFKSTFWISFFYNSALLSRQDAEYLGNKFLSEMKRIAG